AVERRDHGGVGQRDARGLDALALLVCQVRGEGLRVVRRGVHVRRPERVVQLGQRVQERLPVVLDVLGRLLLEVAEDRQRLEQRRRRPGGGHVGELGPVLLHLAAVVAPATTGQQGGREQERGDESHPSNARSS